VKLVFPIAQQFRPIAWLLVNGTMQSRQSANARLWEVGGASLPSRGGGRSVFQRCCQAATSRGPANASGRPGERRQHGRRSISTATYD